MDRHAQIMQQNMFKNSGGKIFEINNTQEEWKNLARHLTENKISFRSFSVVEKQDKLIVYYLNVLSIYSLLIYLFGSNLCLERY